MLGVQEVGQRHCWGRGGGDRGGQPGTTWQRTRGTSALEPNAMVHVRLRAAREPGDLPHRGRPLEIVNCEECHEQAPGEACSEGRLSKTPCLPSFLPRLAGAISVRGDLAGRSRAVQRAGC